MEKLIGPFTQILTLSDMPLKGALTDDQLHVIPNGGVWVNDGVIVAVDNYEQLSKTYTGTERLEIDGPALLMPGFIDCHTHICYAGNRARDYAMRIQGKSYLEIANSGGGIWDSVTQTRMATEEELTLLVQERAQQHFTRGVTTMEVKSGYGLNTADEYKQLKAIVSATASSGINLITTCLAAHILPKDFNGSQTDYLKYIFHELLPLIKKEQLSNRVDIFVEDGAFTCENALIYLDNAKKMGFDLIVHADQFSTGGSEVAVKMGAVSADHLEASTEYEIKLLANSNTVAVALPGASLGLGMPYTPARKLLDAGACLAIASDWNPGSAPMGDLLLQAAVMGASEKLGTAETFAALTYRAAKALNLNDRGILAPGKRADLQVYPCNDYREILYNQGSLKPSQVMAFKKACQIN